MDFPNSITRRSSIKSEHASPSVWDARPQKRRRSSVRGLDSTSPSEEGESSPWTERRVKVSDTEELVRFYDQSFKDLQQVNCKSVAKVWIKAIEEKKQINHPYNGGKPDGPFGGDSERSKPPWWPRNIQHKEPDHLKKPCMFNNPGSLETNAMMTDCPPRSGGAAHAHPHPDFRPSQMGRQSCNRPQARGRPRDIEQQQDPAGQGGVGHRHGGPSREADPRALGGWGSWYVVLCLPRGGAR